MSALNDVSTINSNLPQTHSQCISQYSTSSGTHIQWHCTSVALHIQWHSTNQEFVHNYTWSPSSAQQWPLLGATISVKSKQMQQTLSSNISSDVKGPEDLCRFSHQWPSDGTEVNSLTPISKKPGHLPPEDMTIYIWTMDHGWDELLLHNKSGINPKNEQYCCHTTS